MPSFAKRDLYAAVFRRHSVRTFTGEELRPEDLASLQAACAAPLPAAPGTRLRLVTEGAGRILPRPVFKGVPAFLAVIGKPIAPRPGVAAGYRGEYAVLAATALGLGTCWVSGTYRRAEAIRLAGLEEEETLHAVIAVGYGAEEPRLVERVFKAAAGSGVRRALEELIDPAGLPPAEIPGWTRTALEAARLAPSARNRQPWRFLVEKEAIAVMVDSSRPSPLSKELDYGIAMLHLELGAAVAGVDGEWEWRKGQEVARFRKTARRP